MVDHVTRRILNYLSVVHAATSYTGIETFHIEHRGVVPTTRTLYRWQRAHLLDFFPTYRVSGLGLRHVHAFLPGAYHSPFAIDAARVTTLDGKTYTYLHCLLPQECQIPQDAGARVVTTEDGWQRWNPTILGSDDPIGRPPPPRLLHHASTIAEFPLIAPIILEQQSHYKGCERIWQDITARLGDRVWSYLPRGTRRLHHNGKRYVIDGLHRLSEDGVFRQNVVRYHPAQSSHLELTVVLQHRPDHEWLSRLHEECLSTETFDGDDGMVLRLSAGIDALRTTMQLVSEEHGTAYLHLNTIPTRFAYETIFHPNDHTWQEVPAWQMTSTSSQPHSAATK